MTSILVETLADARDGSRFLDATITATATRARAVGPVLKLPEPVTVRLRKGQLSTPLELDEPDATWAWTISVRATGAPLRRAMTGTYRFAGVTVTWENLEPVDPKTLVPLNPVPPTVQQVLDLATTKAEAAETAADNAAAAQASAAGYASSASASADLAGEFADQSLVQIARDPDQIIVGGITRNASDVITSAAVLWPGGVPGTFTTDVIDPSGAINGYHVTYGSPVTKTFTQPTMTRNAQGAVTVLPQIVVT